MLIKPQSLAFTLFLGALSALAPLSIDMGLPGIPAIEDSFAGASGQGALTLSLFLAGFAISPSICGPLSDRYGRRWPLMVGLSLFAASAAASAYAPSFQALLFFRLLQGLAAGACVVMPLAMVRDLFDGAKSLSLLSQMSAVLGMAPLLAPILGGWVMVVSDWRMIYLAQAAIGFALLIVTLTSCAESLPAERRRSLSLGQLVSSYITVLADKRFVGFSLVYAFGFAGMFSYISGSASVLMGELGLSETTFSLVFAATSCGILFASLLSNTLSKRYVSAIKLMDAGLGLMLAGVISLFGLTILGQVHLFTIAPLVCVVIFSFGLITPSTNHEALQGLGHVAGSAAGILRCMQMLFGAMASGLIAALEPIGNPALNMAGLMLVFAFLAGAAYLFSRRA